MGDTQKFLVNALAVLVLAGVALRLTVIEVVTIDSNAMAPTLTYGDQVLVLTVPGFDMADILICEHPAEKGVPVIGRAIVFAGHTVRTDDRGELYVDRDRATINLQAEVFMFYDVILGKHFQMQLGEVSYFGRHDHAFIRMPGDALRIRSTTVTSGVYLLGDNRQEWTQDSRGFGEVDVSTCIGKVIVRWAPAPPTDDDIDHGHLELIR